MTPILGIMASQISGHLAPPAVGFVSISTTTVGSGGQASITFSSIPQTFKHLQIRGTTPYQSSVNGVFARPNNDTGANYTFHQIYGNGSVAGVNASTGETWANISTSSGASGYNSVSVTDILDYTNTNKYKTFRNLTGHDTNGAGGNTISLRSALWMSTAAITSLVIQFDNSQNLAQYTSFALYGIQG
jgi:hypothetical protein